MKESILKKYTEGLGLEEGYKRIREGFAFIDERVRNVQSFRQRRGRHP